MAFLRTKKLTDTAYSPEPPASESAIRSQIDGSVQECFDMLDSTTPTTSGADYVKSAPITGLLGGVAGTVFAMLSALKTYTDSILTQVQTVVLGQIPDGTLTDLKLSNVTGQIKDIVTTHLSDNTQKFNSIDANLANSNLLINGGLTVAQRYNSSDSTTFTNPSNKYILDRFKCNGTGTVVPVTGGGMTITGTINVKYIMEDKDFNSINGKTVTLTKSVAGVKTTSTFVVSSATVIDLSFTDVTVNWFKLELGSLSTPFTPRSYSEELSLCQRYYETGQFLIVNKTPSVACVSFGSASKYAKVKRIVPTVIVTKVSDMDGATITVTATLYGLADTMGGIGLSATRTETLLWLTANIDAEL